MSHTSTQLSQELLGNFYSRRLLLHTPLYQQPTTAAAPPSMPTTTIINHDMSEGAFPGYNSFNSYVVMVLSVLLLALIFSLGLNSIIRCALRCSNLVTSELSHSDPTPSSAPARLVINTGIKKKSMKMFPTIQYSEGLKLPGLGADCVICLTEFAPGERLWLFPKCNHGFHSQCIDRWLSSHSSCPTCRHCLVQACQKIGSGCSSTSCTTSSQTSQLASLQQDHTILSITPLQPEGLIHSY